MNIDHVTEWFLEPSDVFLQPFVSFYVCLPLSLSLFLSLSIDRVLYSLSHTVYFRCIFWLCLPIIFHNTTSDSIILCS